MKTRGLLFGLILVAAVLSLLFFPVDYSLFSINIVTLSLIIFGAIIFILGLRITTEHTPAPQGEWGGTTWTGRRYPWIFSGLVLMFASLTSAFFPFSIGGYDAGSLAIGILGLISILFGFR